MNNNNACTTTCQSSAGTPTPASGDANSWATSPSIVNVYKALRIKTDNDFDPGLWDRSQAAIRLSMPVDEFERRLRIGVGPIGIDPDNLVFKAEDIENYAIRLYGNTTGRPDQGNVRISEPPSFMSREFFNSCKRVQSGVESQCWPDNAVMLTVKLASPNVTDISGFNSLMLDRVAKTHVNLLFNMMQEHKHGTYRYQKRKAISPAVVMPERISKKEKDEPRKLVTLHYHAVIGFGTHEEAVQFKKDKGDKLISRTLHYVRPGLPRSSNTPAEHYRFDHMDLDLTVFDSGQGAKAFSYACKYAYDLLGYSRVCTPENAIAA